ncbi:MAG: MFS transporter [Chloroflexi bacterium]|nr:MFS transporter [Chloroflexota bacterium]MCL5109710.1 MFS transporter [Chloroflexota bacterium]
MSTLIITTDTGGINVALHTLASHFGVDSGTASWLPLLAFLIVTATLLPFGQLSDLVGSKRVFAAGFAVYGVGSLLCGLAGTFPMLVASRALQALGISMISANSQAILTECFPPSQRGMAMGISSTVVGLGYFVGPIIAGLVIDNFGWRFVFLVTLPIALAGLVTALLVLPESQRRRLGGFDIPGALVFAAAAASVILALNFARGSSFASPTVLALLGLAALGTLGFVAIERRAAAPMLELGMLRNRLFSLSLLSAFLLFVGISGEDLLVPLFVQEVLRLPATTAGLTLSIVPFIRMLLSSPSGLLSDRLGSRWLVSAGAGLSALGLLGLSRMDATSSLAWPILCLASIGLGTGLFFSPNMHATMSAVPPHRLGMGSGAMALRRNLGQSLGVALAAYLLQTGSAGTVGQVPGFQLAFTVQTASVALATLAALAAGSTLSARARTRRAAGRTT